MIGKAKLFILISLLFMLGCEGKVVGRKPDTKVVTGPKYVSKGDEAKIVGLFKYEGAIPETAPIDMSSDEICKQKNPNATSEAVVVNNLMLQNVIVYVKDGPAIQFSYDPPSEPFLLTQNGCQYRPHIVVLQTNQPLKVTTEDETIHNINFQSSINKGFSRSQLPKGAPVVTTFSKPEIFPLRSNQYAWMRAYVGVFTHPFFDVTDKDGRFEIEGLMPGEYTIEAWHEKLGIQSIKVTVGANQTKSVEMTSADFRAVN
ncbi:MAG: hypothetical protein JNN15_04730 [Blastocatellia bacterium]|nr:hypothetical protein [Blastocatellia bacterium]